MTGSKDNLIARTYRVSGRVQGVGFRYFVKETGEALGVRGFVRNEDDGSVFVYAIGDSLTLARFADAIHTGPRLSEVRTVEVKDAVKDAAVLKYNSFRIER